MTGSDPRIGCVVSDRYRVLRRIGEGGMGVVYEAEEIGPGRRVAIKCLHAHLVDRQDIVKRFRREALAASSIGHPNIVEVVETGTFDDGDHYMALELLEGRDLAADIAVDGPLRVGRLVHIVSQICDALGAAHDKGIIHRDLKPENVYLVRRGSSEDFVKVLDFGISKFRDAIDGAVSQMTRTGTTVGTPYYMAPEQAQANKDIDLRVDVYALGVILFRALTGQHPFDDASYPMLVLKICTEAPPPVRMYRPDVPVELERVVLRMLAKPPDERYPDCAAVREALAPFRGIDLVPVLTDAPGTASTRASALDGPGARVDSPAAHAATAPMQGAAGGAGQVAEGPWTSGPGLPGATPPTAEGVDEPLDDDPETEALVRGASTSNLVRWVMLGAAVLTVVLVAVLALTMEPDRPVEAQVDLPEPAPPVTRALVSSGQGGIGWTWVNPQPRAMPSWYDVDVAGPGLVAMAGFAGQAARFSGGGMYLWPTGTDVSLHGIAWSGAREALVVGGQGTVLLLQIDGEPQVIESGTELTLRDVLTVSPTQAWVVGDDGTLLRLSAYRAAAVDAGTDADLLAAHLRGDGVVVVGDRGTILRIEGGAVMPEASGTEATLRAVGGCPGGDLYAAGDEGRLLRRLEDGRWQRVDHELREPLSAIGCDGDRAVVSGLRGGVLLAAGRRAVVLPSGTDRSLHGVSGARESPTWVVGDGGRLMHVEGDHLRTLTAGPTVPLRDLGVIAGALVAVGEWGRIVRQRERGFEEAETPTASALAGVAPMGADRLVAVGDNGAIVEIRHDAARLVESPAENHLRDVVSDGTTLLAVGVGGTLVRGVEGAFEVSRVRDVGDIWSVTGLPGDAVAVGEEGLVLRVREGRSTRIPCEVATGLRAVWRGPEGTWAAGEGGVIVRIGQTSCEVERAAAPDAPTLNGLGPAPGGGPLAVGDRGTALERTAEGAWERADLDVGRASLRSVFRTERNVWIAGAGGVIVRHIRLDGG